MPFKHGHCIGKDSSPTYRSWAVMIQRCTNPAFPKFKRYGARGISVCEQWLEFSGFLADMGEKPAGMTLERVDVNGDYEPANCVWASPKVQANNKTNNRLLTHEGMTMTTAQWAEHLGMSFTTLRMRLHRKWPLNQVLTPTLFSNSGTRKARSPQKAATGTTETEPLDIR